MSTVRVHLAEVPTDVLVWLADQPANEWFTAIAIASHVAPIGADRPLHAVIDALELLCAGGYVIRSREVGGWAATAVGWQAVQDAKGSEDV